MSRRFQFRLRTLLVGTAIVAMPLSWAAYNTILVQQRQAMLRDHAGQIDAVVGDGDLPWLRRTIGDQYVWNLDISGEMSTTSELVTDLQRLFPEAWIGLADGTEIMPFERQGLIIQYVEQVEPPGGKFGRRVQDDSGDR